jgi:hypothetical protein
MMSSVYHVLVELDGIGEPSRVSRCITLERGAASTQGMRTVPWFSLSGTPITYRYPAVDTYGNFHPTVPVKLGVGRNQKCGINLFRNASTTMTEKFTEIETALGML